MKQNLHHFRRSLVRRWACALLTVSLLSSCGGGGGGGDEEFVGAARVFITVSPSALDAGERTKVQINISEVNELGISVKIKFPSGLAYVPETSHLEVDGAQFNTGPFNNVTVEDSTYLVYYFSQKVFGKRGEGTLSFSLKANAIVTDGIVEVDADIDDPFIANTIEFDSADPKFVAEDAQQIEVE